MLKVAWMMPKPKLAACAMNLSWWATDKPAVAAIVLPIPHRNFRQGRYPT